MSPGEARHGTAADATEAQDVSPARTRDREVSWLNKNQENYRGQWLAIEGDQLIAHDRDYTTVRCGAIAAGGIKVPFIVRVPDEPIRYHFMGL